MDALQLLRKTALLVASGLLLATAGMADDLVVDNNNVAINLTTTVQTVRVKSTTGNPTPFMIGPINYDQPYQWLSVTADTLTTPATLTITRFYTPPFAGPFTAHFSAIPSSGQSQTINVTYTTAIVQPSGLPVIPSSSNPSYSLQMSYTTNGTLPTQQVTVSGVSSYTASTTAGWLVLGAGGQTGTNVTDSSGTGPLTITVDQSAVASLGTAPATYQQNVSVTGPSGSGLEATIVVTLAVNGGTGTAIAVTPTSLNFSYQTGGPSMPPQTIVITSPASTVYGAQTDVSWLALSGAQGDVPGQIQVYLVSSAASGLATNTYTGHVTINDGSLTTSVAVSLVVTNSPILTATVANGTGTLLFNSQGSVANPASQTVTLAASDGSAITPAIVSNPNWTTVTLNGNVLTVTPNVSALSAATYADNIVISANGLANISIPIVLIANGGGNAGPLTFSQSSLSFIGTVSGTPPSPQNLIVTGPAGTPFTLTAQTTSGGNWLTVSPSGSLTLPTNTTLTIAVNPAVVGGAGTYNGSLQFNSNGVNQVIPVTLALTGTASGGNVTSTPTSLSLSTQFGGTAQTAQLTISNAVSGTAGIVYTVSTSASWLKATPTQATTQSIITVTADPTGLAPGPYTGQVTITPTGGAILNVPVTFSVQALPTISVSTTSLTFTYRSGGPLPAAQTVGVTGGAFTTQVTSDGSWLAAAPISAGPSLSNTTLGVSVTPTGLSIGTHTGTVTVSGTNGVTGQVVINVTLTVTAPLPTVTSLVNGASFIQSSISPGEIITLMGTDLGPATPATAQIDATGKLATQLGGVQVLVNGFLAPMVYASATQVSAVVPYEIATYPTAYTQVKYVGQSSNAVGLAVSSTAPGIFTLNSSGSGPGAFNADFSPNGPNNPVAKGGTVVFFLTGEGLLTPAGVTGTINGANPAAPVQHASVLIDGQGANYTYAGGITGVVEGIMQINVQMPADAGSGDLPVVITVGGRSTQSGVTVSVK
jgi:uncharacterized protein (TIGR03437 family)